MSKFAETFVVLRQHPFSLAARPYLQALYTSPRRQIVVRASRQVEKSTFLAIFLLFHAVSYPGHRLLYICPRQEQARVFSQSRLLPLILNSPILQRVLLGSKRRKLQVSNLRFANGAEINIRSAYLNADAVRGLDADVLLVDEYQDVASGHLPVLKESLSHSPIRRVVLAGTPKVLTNHLEAAFNQSTANQFQVPCPGCGASCVLDEHCLGPLGPICASCQHAIDPREGRWVARDPDSTWGDGFWINHLMVPWVCYGDVLQKQQDYDAVLFRTEVLGLPVQLGDHMVTMAQLQACCEPRPNAATLRDVSSEAVNSIVAGIDWGAGGAARTAVVFGYMRRDNVFVVLRFERFSGREDPVQLVKEIAQRCDRFNVRWIAADGLGNGLVNNRLLLNELGGKGELFAIAYGQSDREPLSDGVLWNWQVHRSMAIGKVFRRVQERSITFPRAEAVESYLHEFACEIAKYDEHLRCLRFTHPPTQPDDCLHACVYGQLLANFLFLSGTLVPDVA